MFEDLLRDQPRLGNLIRANNPHPKLLEHWLK